MSHRPERKEKDCLNCGSIVQGRYCQVCGQENSEPKETFWSMTVHFLADITHFDGKFFITLKDLLFKPGFLSAEYARGRRVSYLHPVRMYVFSSAIFFLVFFSLTSGEKIKIAGDGPMRQSQRDSIVTRMRNLDPGDSLDGEDRRVIALLLDSTKEARPSDMLSKGEKFNVLGTINGHYKSLAEYDSVQDALKGPERDGWWARIWNRKAMELNDRYEQRGQAVTGEEISEIILHKLPYLLFVSLPFFALILKLIYIRRKEFYYGDHAIFSVHHYILSFILLLLIFLFNALDKFSGWSIWDIFAIITGIAWPVYLFLAMRRFYGQGRFKTFMKFLILNLLGLITIIILFAFFMLFSFFQL